MSLGLTGLLGRLVSGVSSAHKPDKIARTRLWHGGCQAGAMPADPSYGSVLISTLSKCGPLYIVDGNLLSSHNFGITMITMIHDMKILL